MPDLVLTITYPDDTIDACTITEDDLATWTDYQQPQTVDRNIELQTLVKTLRASLLSLGAKSINLAPPAPTP